MISPRPRVVLKARRAQPFFHRHPWVFSGAIQKVEGHPQPGTEVDLYSDLGEWIARGLYNPNSNIRTRLYSWNPELDLDRAFWQQQIRTAIDARRRLFSLEDPQVGCRLIFSEADGLSGLTVDRYGDWLLVQMTSLALDRIRDDLLGILQEELQPKGIFLRTEKGIGETEGLELADGLIRGEEPPRPFFLTENGIRFGVDLHQGQKTGFYLDQRENRRTMADYLVRNSLVTEPRVLDLFCYTGGFSLAAAVLGNAPEVLGIDVSEPALQIAESNAELNGVADRCRFRKAKVFSALEELMAAGEKFDAVVLDPPKMTRSRSSLNQAMKGYHSLNRMAASLLNPGGLFVTCSCSGLVSEEMFLSMLSDVSVDLGRGVQILERRAAAPDHPTSVFCPETHYLKCLICRVE